MKRITVRRLRPVRLPATAGAIYDGDSLGWPGCDPVFHEPPVAS